MPISGPDRRSRYGMAVRLGARGETPATFERRCIPPHHSRCYAGFHHGLLVAKVAVVSLSLGCLVFPRAVWAQVDNAAIFEQGQQLYGERCLRCHGATGEGNPPTFPALSGNDRLGDVARIVQVIRQGSGNMPPFPALTAADISTLASYVRNAWTNDFGSVTTDAVGAEANTSPDPGQTASVWDGVFTDAQATRGRTAYSGACGFCHGRRLDGAPDDPDMRSTPPLARARFVREWEGRSLATLYEYTRLTMPEDNPNSLTDEEYVDIIAYMLSVNGMPAGNDELAPDSRNLAHVVIRQRQ